MAAIFRRHKGISFFCVLMDWELCHRPPADVPQELAVLRARALDACFAGEKVAEGKAFGIPEIFLIQMNVLKYSTSFLRFSRGRIAPPARLRRKNKKGRFPAKRWLLAGASSFLVVKKGRRG